MLASADGQVKFQIPDIASKFACCSAELAENYAKQEKELTKLSRWAMV